MKFNEYVKEEKLEEGKVESDMSKNIEQMVKLVNSISASWSELDDDTANKISKNFPKYLPSFDEFAMDLEDWADEAKKALR